MRFSAICKLILTLLFIALLRVVGVLPLVHADSTPIIPPLAIDWSATTLLSVNDDWSGVRGIEGYLGQNLTATVGADPQTLLTTSTLAADLDLIANQSNPNGLNSGGVAEFDGIADPVIALQGSGTADAPYLLLHLDTTGLSEINISYNLRDLDGSADDAVQPVALQYRIGDSGNFTNLPAGFVADATSGPGLATLVTPVSVTLPAEVAGRPLVQVRIITANASGNDEWVGIDDLVVVPGRSARLLTIDDVARAEGDGATTLFNFTVRLSVPAGAEGVSFDIATLDGTAGADDYVARPSSRQMIPPGSSSYTLPVEVRGDLATEPDETFFVEVSGVTGAVAIVTRGTGTILNDDYALVGIHDIQGAGSVSPLVGGTVRTRGIVTGRRSTGFFIQSPVADGDPLTSEGILVYSGVTPPVAATVGTLVEVTGRVAEYVPSNDPLQPPVTQLIQPVVTPVATGQPLPEPAVLTFNLPDPAGAFDQLERLEGMRVRIPSLTVVGPTLGTISESSATASSTGVFFGVVSGVARPFREPGIQPFDLAGVGPAVMLPRFDNNPERIRVDSNGLTGAPVLNLAAGTVVEGLVGPLDYASRNYTLLPEPGAPLTVSGGAAPTPVPLVEDGELTIATFNLQRLYDTVNDPAIAEPVLTAAAFDNRLRKASLAIRDYLRTPDILGVVEVENLPTLQALAARIGTDAVAAGQVDPQYAAYLVEGNDVGGIDVGFLVRTAPVNTATPRVKVEAVTQVLAASRLVNPDGSTDLLNDRPPLLMKAVVNHAAGAGFPVTVIVNHLRSLGGVSDTSPGSSGWPTSGERVRAKRQRQAEDLARLVQARQLADPAERIVLIGDFNAFEFNDGFTDSLGTISGQPAPAAETVVTGDGADLVDPDLVNLSALAPASDRYSYVFDGNAQSLDHLLINRAMVNATLARRVEHPRLNADFPETARNDAASPLRLSDHDPLVGYFRIAGFSSNPVPVLPGPGEAVPPASAASASRAGSVLFFNAYSSTVDRRHDTAISLTNTHPAQAASVRLFLIDGGTGDVGNLTLTLTAGQTVRFLASEQDPGTVGYLMAVAIDEHGCPLDFNHLIGEATVSWESGHVANLAAFAVPALPAVAALCQPGALAVELPFDGNVFGQLPRTLAVNSIPSRVDGYQTLLVINRLGGSLVSGVTGLGELYGTIYDDLEAGWSFTIQAGTPQLRGVLASATFPRTSLRFENVVPPGRTGWMRLAAVEEAGIAGAVINRHEADFNGGHNLHVLTLTPAVRYLFPILPPR